MAASSVVISINIRLYERTRKIGASNNSMFLKKTHNLNNLGSVDMQSGIIFALDIGTRSIKGIVAEQVGEKLKIKAQYKLEHQSRSMYDGQIHDIPKVAAAVVQVKTQLEKKTGDKLDKVAIAAAGRSLKTVLCRVDQDIDNTVEIDANLVRSLEMSGLQKSYKLLEAEQTGNAKFYCVGHSVVTYYLNDYVIANLIGHRGESIGADILATFLPDSVVNSLYAVLERSGLEPVSLTLEPIAAIDVAIPEDIRMLNLALVDIGAGTSDIAITSGGAITAYGMVPMAGDEITEAIVDKLLVDFNTAEEIKRQLVTGKDVVYKDILGIENKISSRELAGIVEKELEALADKITDEIRRLNGDRSPKTVFCIGGGSQLPLLDEKIAERLQLPKQRVAVRDRSVLANIVTPKRDVIGGPEGVTVLGIASIALKQIGHDFISVTVNGSECKLFNFQKLTVANVLGQVNYNPRDLIALNGKNLSFYLNGALRQVYGELGRPAQITVNDQPAHLQTKINDGDCIEVVKAVPGKDAELTLKELAKSYGVGYQDILVNGHTAEEDYLINNGDVLEIKSRAECEAKPPKKVKPPSNDQAVTVTVNGERVKLHGVKKPVFVDVFNYIDFNINEAKGKVVLKVNGQEVGYVHPLQEGDELEIYWQEEDKRMK